MHHRILVLIKMTKMHDISKDVFNLTYCNECAFTVYGSSCSSMV